MKDPLPILHENRSIYDWETATYTPKLSVNRQTLEVRHIVEDAEPLKSLVAVGTAEWAVELRCPAALYAKTVTSSDETTIADWRETEVDGERGMYFIPGLVTIAPVKLSTEGLTDLWGDVPIEVPAGTWLVRGLVHSLHPLMASLVEFYEDKGLPDGGMRLEKPVGDESITFSAYLASNIYPPQRDKRVWHSALVGVFALLPDLARDIETGSVAENLLDLLRDRLLEKDTSFKDWHSDEYDASRGATILEPFVQQSEEWDQGQ